VQLFDYKSASTREERDSEVIVVGIIAIDLVAALFIKTLTITLMGATHSSRRRLEEVEARTDRLVLPQRSPAVRERAARRVRQIEQPRQVHAAFNSAET
jgi:hypothetical protein